MTPSPLPDVIAEGHRLVAAIQAEALAIRLSGGLAVRHWCPSAAAAPFARPYADVDLVASSQISPGQMDAFMTALGYEADTEFNSVHGHQRLYYIDRSNARHVDVFVDALSMCHEIYLAPRLLRNDRALDPSDLLLTKLQVVELNAKDVLDIAVLLHDLPLSTDDRSGTLDAPYLQGIWARDWPLWRTSVSSMAKVRTAVPSLLGEPATQAVLTAATALEKVMSSGSRTLRWRVRSVVGDRLRWYTIPEEVEQ